MTDTGERGDGAVRLLPRVGSGAGVSTSRPPPVAQFPSPPDAARLRLIRRAKLLAWASLGWMTIEGAVALAAGIATGSVALVGFGLDSAVEGLASVIVIWRFAAARAFSEEAERRAQKLVAVSFFLLAPYVAGQAIDDLVTGSHPESSWVGIALTVGSIAFMPLFGRAKQRIGAELGSAATAGEGAQNLLCAYMAAGVLVGLAANAAFGWWWLDGVIALGIAALAVREGLEAWKGEGCCVASPLDGQIDACREDCC